MMRSAMETRVIKEPTKMLIGPPAEPMAAERADALAQLVASLPGALEAHLPECMIVGGTEKPAQILAIVFESPPSPQTLEMLGSGLADILPPGKHLDMWPIAPDNPSLMDIRDVGCEIYLRPGRSYWRSADQKNK
jgi:hypothetical protein